MWRVVARFAGEFLIVFVENVHPVFKVYLTQHGVSLAAVRAVMGGRELLSFFEQEVSLCERVGCFRNWATVLLV